MRRDDRPRRISTLDDSLQLEEERRTMPLSNQEEGAWPFPNWRARKKTNPDGSITKEVCTTQADIEEIQTSNWAKLYGLGESGLTDNHLVDQTLMGIRNDPTSRISTDQAGKLHPDILFKQEAIQEAIGSMSESAAGEDGLTHSFFKDHLDTVTPILSDLFHECYTTGHMTEEMRRAKVTLAFKGGELEDTLWSNYSPIAVTEMVYRIMGRCVQLKVATMLRGTFPYRRITEGVYPWGSY